MKLFFLKTSGKIGLMAKIQKSEESRPHFFSILHDMGTSEQTLSRTWRGTSDELKSGKVQVRSVSVCS